MHDAQNSGKQMRCAVVKNYASQQILLLPY